MVQAVASQKTSSCHHGRSCRSTKQKASVSLCLDWHVTNDDNSAAFLGEDRYYWF